MKFIVYRNSDGAILRTGECIDADLSLQAQTGQTAIEGEANDGTQYISGGTVTTRPSLAATWDKTSITANGIDTATLGATLPNPTTVTVEVPASAIVPDAEQVTTGSFSIATTIAGDYTVNVYPPFPYLSVTQVITAT